MTVPFSFFTLDRFAMGDYRIRTALISVSDKSGIERFAKYLTERGVHILSTGGTLRALKAAGTTVEEVSAYTGHPEMMDGRVKTLHPRVHGALLGRLDAEGGGTDAAVMAEHGIRPIDLVVVNLYPFQQTVARAGVTLAEAIENIDIGGPAMLRSAAKNFERVAVVVDTSDYDDVMGELDTNDGCLSRTTRFRLAVKAFEHVARYDVAIAEYLQKVHID